MVIRSKKSRISATAPDDFFGNRELGNLLSFTHLFHYIIIKDINKNIKTLKLEIIHGDNNMTLTFENIASIFATNLCGKSCIEIEFCITDLDEYQDCWMGKMPDKTDKSKDLYWYGLVKDGSQAYGYDNFDDFASAPVFNDESLKDIWNKIELVSIDGCAPDEDTLEMLGYKF